VTDNAIILCATAVEVQNTKRWNLAQKCSLIWGRCLYILCWLLAIYCLFIQI